MVDFDGCVKCGDGQGRGSMDVAMGKMGAQNESPDHNAIFEKLRSGPIQVALQPVPGGISGPSGGRFA